MPFDAPPCRMCDSWARDGKENLPDRHEVEQPVGGTGTHTLERRGQLLVADNSLGNERSTPVPDAVLGDFAQFVILLAMSRRLAHPPAHLPTPGSGISSAQAALSVPGRAGEHAKGDNLAPNPSAAAEMQGIPDCSVLHGAFSSRLTCTLAQGSEGRTREDERTGSHATDSRTGGQPSEYSDSASATIWWALGELFSRNGKAREAIEFFDKSIGTCYLQRTQAFD